MTSEERPQRGDFRHLERLRVRWAEIDAQQIVFNGHYLTYFDTAVAGYWRALALPYHDTMATLGGDLYVRRATLDYLGSARYDETLHVGIRTARFGTSSMTLRGGVFRGLSLLVGGDLVYVFADPTTQTSRPVPATLRAVIEAFERGEPMVDVTLGDWATLEADAAPLRRRVFVDEQGVPAALEWDAADATALHAVARNRLGLALATGRLLPAGDDGLAKVGRMAVRAEQRGGGLGRQVLDALVDAARARGDRGVRLAAQTTARDFYGRAGFVDEGEPFEKAGLPHQTMVRRWA